MNENLSYISFQFDGEEFWVEIDENGYAIRQIIVNSDKNFPVNRLTRKVCPNLHLLPYSFDIVFESISKERL